jgi:hypothetical protein
MLEDLLSGNKGLPCNHSLISTHRCRRLVLKRAAAVLHDIFLKTFEMVIETSTGNDIAKFSIDSFGDGTWLSKWRGRCSGNYSITEKRFSCMIRIMEGIVRESSAHSALSPALIIEGQKEIIKRQKKLIKRQEQLDLLEWKDLETQGANMYEMVKRQTDSYLLTVRAGEAQVANNQGCR